MAAQQDVSSFGCLVGAACREVEAAGPWVFKTVKKTKTVKSSIVRVQSERQRVAALQDELKEAVMACDMQAALGAVNRGADLHGSFSSPIGLFQEWIGALVRDGMRKDSLKPAISGASAKAMILWLDQQNVSMLYYTVNEKESRAMSAQRVLQCLDPISRRNFRLEEIKNINLIPLNGSTKVAEVLCALSQSWSHDPDIKARVAIQEWMDSIFDPCGEWGAESLAIDLGRTGAAMKTKHWEALGERLYRINPKTVCDLLNVQPQNAKLDKKALAMLISHALIRNSLEELSALALRSAVPMWSLPPEMWTKMDVHVLTGSRGPTLLEYAVYCACGAETQGHLTRTGIAIRNGLPACSYPNSSSCIGP